MNLYEKLDAYLNANKGITAEAEIQKAFENYTHSDTDVNSALAELKVYRTKLYSAGNNIYNFEPRFVLHITWENLQHQEDSTTVCIKDIFSLVFPQICSELTQNNVECLFLEKIWSFAVA